MNLRALLAEPLPLLHVEVAEELPESSPMPFDSMELLRQSALLLGETFNGLLACRFRGISLDRLSVVLRTGIDVEPSDSPIYADFLDKAWEYGGVPKLILALDLSGLERTFKEIPADTPAGEVARLQERYPTLLPPSAGGTTIWLSRLAECDPHIATPYEYNSAWWIPGDPFTVLKCALLFGRHSDDLPERVKTILATLHSE